MLGNIVLQYNNLLNALTVAKVIHFWHLKRLVISTLIALNWLMLALNCQMPVLSFAGSCGGISATGLQTNSDDRKYVFLLATSCSEYVNDYQ